MCYVLFSLLFVCYSKYVKPDFRIVTDSNVSCAKCANTETDSDWLQFPSVNGINDDRCRGSPIDVITFHSTVIPIHHWTDALLSTVHTFHADNRHRLFRSRFGELSSRTKLTDRVSSTLCWQCGDSLQCYQGRSTVTGRVRGNELCIYSSLTLDLLPVTSVPHWAIKCVWLYMIWAITVSIILYVR